MGVEVIKRNQANLERGQTHMEHPKPKLPPKNRNEEGIPEENTEMVPDRIDMVFDKNIYPRPLTIIFLDEVQHVCKKNKKILII